MKQLDFKPSIRRWDDTRPDYAGAPLARLLLRIAAWLKGHNLDQAHERANAEPTLNISRQLSP